MTKVQFVFPEALTQDDDVVYIGDLTRFADYQQETKVRLFVSLTTMTSTLAPLLLLSEVCDIQVQTGLGCNPITIRTDTLRLDIEEQIDNALHRGVPSSTTSCVYRDILGEQVSISDHNCRDHTW
jgi:hypothetical protein